MTHKQFDWLYNKAKELMAQTKDPVHDWGHVKRVMDDALKIKALLPMEKQVKVDDKILSVTAAWHDISYINYRASFMQYLLEGRRSVKLAKKYFKQAEIDKREIKIICRVILRHSAKEVRLLRRIIKKRKKNIYAQLIEDADWLENFNQDRIKQAENSNQTLFKKFAMKFLKPLFFNFLLNNKKRFLHLRESLEI